MFSSFLNPNPRIKSHFSPPSLTFYISGTSITISVMMVLCIATLYFHCMSDARRFCLSSEELMKRHAVGLKKYFINSFLNVVVSNNHFITLTLSNAGRFTCQGKSSRKGIQGRVNGKRHIAISCL